MSKRTPSDASPAVDPVFALAAAESSRRRDYEARCAQFQRELDRLAKPLNEAGTFIGDCSDEQFARDWAITLMSAGQAITEAGLCEIVEDREEWMPARLARAALRAANRGRAEVEAATHRIVNDPMQREGVRSSLREIANEFARRLRERHDATLRDEFPTLAPNAVPVAAPPTLPAGTESGVLAAQKGTEAAETALLELARRRVRENGRTLSAAEISAELRPLSLLDYQTAAVLKLEARGVLIPKEHPLPTGNRPADAIKRSFLQRSGPSLWLIGAKLVDEPAALPTTLPPAGTKKSEGGMTQAKPEAPFVPLTSWAEIFGALNEPHGKAEWKNNERTRAKIRGLNEQHNGPIRLGSGKGKQPTVDKAALRTWWNELREHFDARSKEAEAEAEAARLTASDTHGFGKTGTVSPGIGGSVKRTRRDGGKGKEPKK